MVDASHFEYPTPAECLTGTGPKNKVLAANKDTVHW